MKKIWHTPNIIMLKVSKTADPSGKSNSDAERNWAKPKTQARVS